MFCLDKVNYKTTRRGIEVDAVILLNGKAVGTLRQRPGGACIPSLLGTDKLKFDEQAKKNNLSMSDYAEKLLEQWETDFLNK